MTTVQEAGKRGGFARAAKVSANRLSEIGRKGAAARWAKRQAEINKANALAAMKLNEKAEGIRE